jgi:hypothetical protein
MKFVFNSLSNNSATRALIRIQVYDVTHRFNILEQENL